MTSRDAPSRLTCEKTAGRPINRESARAVPLRARVRAGRARCTSEGGRARSTEPRRSQRARNEDAEGRLQLLQDDYEAEIESLLQDASAKVAAASEENGGKAAAALAEKVEALEKSYAAEKKKSLEQLESYKAELKATSESKQADAARALKETQGEMQGRITELEAAIKQAQEGKANDKQELEMVVQMHNAKYNEMMAQQLTEQDKLSAALREAEERDTERAGGKGRAAASSKWRRRRGEDTMVRPSAQRARQHPRRRPHAASAAL